MERYLGVKLIEAEPQLKGHSLGMTKPNQAISEHDFNIPGYKVVYEDGYTSWSPKDVFEKAYRKIKKFDFEYLASKCSEEYQVRVCEEARELDYKISKLNSFITNPAAPFVTLKEDEQTRLKQQLMAMQYYLTILIERIENF